MDHLESPELMARNNGSQPIGAAQRVIAYTVVADGGSLTMNGNAYSTLKITAATHGLKKYQYIYIATGAYAGVHTVLKVVDANNVLVDGIFGATTSGNITLMAARDGFGFYVDSVPLTISSFTPENSNIDPAAFIATVFIAGTYVDMPFKSMVISAGNCTVVRQQIKYAGLTYTNR